MDAGNKTVVLRSSTCKVLVVALLLVRYSKLLAPEARHSQL